MTDQATSTFIIADNKRCANQAGTNNKKCTNTLTANTREIASRARSIVGAKCSTIHGPAPAIKLMEIASKAASETGSQARLSEADGIIVPLMVTTR